MGNNVFSVRDGKTCLNGVPFLVKGLRCSNALVTDAAVDELISNLGVFQSYGVNTISGFFQGSRFGDIKGYREDGSLDASCAARMGRIIEAADALGMVILVGCLYWGNSKAKWESWTQAEANEAVRATAAWLEANDYRNTFIDVDNEGMALVQAGFDNRELVLAAKSTGTTIPVATNFMGYLGGLPKEADLGIHFSCKMPDKPYIQSEGSPENATGGYWGSYSKREGFYGYLNAGVYTEEMKASQIEDTRAHFAAGYGYMLASTWLQAGPPQGPNHNPGGCGTAEDPGVLWWLEWLKEYAA